MSGQMKKNAKDFIPYCQDQGIPNLVGAAKSGVSLQALSEWLMPAGGVVVFANQGLTDMANATYGVLIQNQTSSARPATVGSKLVSGFTITGPNASDVLDIVIVGQLSGQLA